MHESTDPRPTLLDRFRASIKAFRDPGAATLKGVLLGVGIFPLINTESSAR